MFIIMGFTTLLHEKCCKNVQGKCVKDVQEKCVIGFEEKKSKKIIIFDNFCIALLCKIKQHADRVRR